MASLLPGHGQQASTPGEIPPRGWWDVTKRVFSQAGEDHIGLIAAGVAFYAFLALFPALIAVVSFYGAFTDPAELEGQMRALLGVLPPDVHDLLTEQLRSISSGRDETLGLGAALGLLIALWSANKGTKALFEGVNIAYDETNRRGFFAHNALCLLFTLGLAAGMSVAFAVVVLFGAFGGWLDLPTVLTVALGAAGWIVVAAMVVMGLALVYRYAPVRTSPQFRWVSTGAVIALLLWLASSAAFSLYVANFGSYSETYGSLAAVIVFLLWLYISAYAVLLGAEINAEAEHQTVYDTTTGEYKPMGERGAWVADHVARVPRK